MIATRNSWKSQPCPADREHLDLSLVFSDADGERMMAGHIPADMEDKWFIFYEEGWLYFHRSWTGHCIYGVKLDGYPGGVRVVDCWANRDKTQYNSPGIKQEMDLIQRLIATRLLA